MTFTLSTHSKRTAVVSGGAKRVGRAIVERLRTSGFDVLFTYLHSEADARTLSAQCGAAPVRADFADPPSAAAIISAAVREHFGGRLDLLVHNASRYEPGDLAAVTADEFRRTMAVNVESPLLVTQAVAPMLRASRGRVVNLIDVLAERPWPQYVAYCASKAALANLTLSLARALAPEVTVNGIAPGVVDWPADYPDADRAKYLNRVPLGRAGTPADVAELIHFLATEGSYITGQIIRLDGGRSIT